MPVNQLMTIVCSSTAVLLEKVIESSHRILLLATALFVAVCANYPSMPRFHSRTSGSFHFATGLTRSPAQSVCFATQIAVAGAAVAVLALCFVVFGWCWISAPNSSMFAELVLPSLEVESPALPPTPKQNPPSTLAKLHTTPSTTNFPPSISSPSGIVSFPQPAVTLLQQFAPLPPHLPVLVLRHASSGFLAEAPPAC